MWLLLLLACKKPIPDDATVLRDDYFFAWCRLYSAAACVDDQRRSCPTAIDYGTRADCEGFRKFEVAGCTGVEAKLDGIKDTVDRCVSKLQDFGCASDTFCDGGGDATFMSGDCDAVEAAITEACHAPDTDTDGAP